jgi:hypothetical protein
MASGMRFTITGSVHFLMQVLITIVAADGELGGRREGEGVANGVHPYGPSRRTLKPSGTWEPSAKG